MCNHILLHLWQLMYFTFSVKDVSDEGNGREKNELARTGGNTVDGEDKTNVVSCHRDGQEQVIKETLRVQPELKENSNIATEDNNCDNHSPETASDPTMTIQEELKIVINNSMIEGKRRKTPVSFLKFCKVRNLFFSIKKTYVKIYGVKKV
jgi:hypothetical protein